MRNKQQTQASNMEYHESPFTGFPSPHRNNTKLNRKFFRAMKPGSKFNSSFRKDLKSSFEVVNNNFNNSISAFDLSTHTKHMKVPSLNIKKYKPDTSLGSMTTMNRSKKLNNHSNIILSQRATRHVSDTPSKVALQLYTETAFDQEKYSLSDWMGHPEAIKQLERFKVANKPIPTPSINNKLDSDMRRFELNYRGTTLNQSLESQLSFKKTIDYVHPSVKIKIQEQEIHTLEDEATQSNKLNKKLLNKIENLEKVIEDQEFQLYTHALIEQSADEPIRTSTSKL